MLWFWTEKSSKKPEKAGFESSFLKNEAKKMEKQTLLSFKVGGFVKVFDKKTASFYFLLKCDF